MKNSSPYKSALAQALPFHYAWMIVGAAGMVGLVTTSIRLSFGVFVDPLVEKYGWSHGAVSLAYTFQFIGTGVGGVFAGWAMEKYGIRRVMVAGSFLFALGMFLTAIMNSLWLFYLAYGLLLGVSMSFFSTPLITTVTLWFRKKRGLAGGTVWAFQGLGPVVMAPLMRYAISAFSWEQAFLVVGAVGVTIMLAMTTMVRSRPSDVGVVAYGQDPNSADAAEAAAAAKVDEGRFFREVTRTPIFWLLIVIHFLGCVNHSLILVHVVPMAIFKGIDPMAAAAILSIISITTVGSRMGMSVLTDVIGPKGVMGLAIFIQAASVLLLLFISAPMSFYLFAFVFGIGYGGEMVGFPFMDRLFYGNAPIGRLYGVQMLGAGLGMGVGGYIGGAMFDWTGSYVGPILVSSLTGFAALALVYFVKRPSKQAIESLMATASAPAPATGK